MNRSLSICFIHACLILACVSCKEDRNLVEKRETQQKEITRLKIELDLIEVKLKNMPPDMSKELANAQMEVTAQTADVANLEEQVAKLMATKRTIQIEFDAYKEKFPIK
jgi:hypothetical protein